MLNKGRVAVLGCAPTLGGGGKAEPVREATDGHFRSLTCARCKAHALQPEFRTLRLQHALTWVLWHVLSPEQARAVAMNCKGVRQYSAAPGEPASLFVSCCARERALFIMYTARSLATQTDPLAIDQSKRWLAKRWKTVLDAYVHTARHT